jgi:hypothetical protein
MEYRRITQQRLAEMALAETRSVGARACFGHGFNVKDADST